MSVFILDCCQQLTIDDKMERVVFSFLEMFVIAKPSCADRSSHLIGFVMQRKIVIVNYMKLYVSFLMFWIFLEYLFTEFCKYGFFIRDKLKNFGI